MGSDVSRIGFDCALHKVQVWSAVDCALMYDGVVENICQFYGVCCQHPSEASREKG